MNIDNIKEIFLKFILNNEVKYEYKNQLDELVYTCIKTNWKLWNLEDSARMADQGVAHVARIKKRIDETNHFRNSLITEIDILLDKKNKVLSSKPQRYSESPGLVIDRLSILYIKKFCIENLLYLIEERELLEDYLEKQQIILDQIDYLESLLGVYLKKIESGDAFFMIQQPVKIYNDERVKKYIKKLQCK